MLPAPAPSVLSCCCCRCHCAHPTRSIPESTQATALFLAKGDGVLAGLAVAELVCQQVDPSLRLTWSLAGEAQA